MGGIKKPSKWPIIAKLTTNLLKDKDFPYKIASYLNNDQRKVFERAIFDHYRMFFEKE
jgi:hypothetical protein